MASKRIASDFLYNDKGKLNLLATKAEGEDNSDKLRKAQKLLAAVMRDRLTSTQLRYIMLYYYEKHTMGEIGALCAVNKSTVSRTIARGRKIIEDYLTYYFGEV